MVNPDRLRQAGGIRNFVNHREWRADLPLTPVETDILRPAKQAQPSRTR